MCSQFHSLCLIYLSTPNAQLFDKRVYLKFIVSRHSEEVLKYLFSITPIQIHQSIKKRIQGEERQVFFSLYKMILMMSTLLMMSLMIFNFENDMKNFHKQSR